MHPNKAIVAIARKLLVVVWHVLTESTADRRADQEMVAFKLMLWGWKLGEEQRGGLTTPQFVRRGLMKLEIGEELTQIVRGGTKRPVATREKVLSDRGKPAMKPPAAVTPPGAGRINLTCQHIGRRCA